MMIECIIRSALINKMVFVYYSIINESFALSDNYRRDYLYYARPDGQKYLSSRGKEILDA